MIPQDRLDKLDEIIRQARATGNETVLTEALGLVARVLRQNAAGASVSQDDADPMTRAREADGLHRLRKGRDECTAARRDGSGCKAPAVSGTLVCRRHGGSAPQVQIKARHQELQMALYTANCEFDNARGTPREFGALCNVSAARRELDAYEVKLRLLAELRADVRRKRVQIAAADVPDPVMGLTSAR